MMLAQPYEMSEGQTAGGTSDVYNRSSSDTDQIQPMTVPRLDSYVQRPSPSGHLASTFNNILESLLMPGGKATIPTSDLKAILSMDTVAVRHAEDNQIVEEHFLQELKRATAQTNRAEGECDDIRRRLKHLRSQLETALHKKKCIEDTVIDYTTRLNTMSDELRSAKVEIQSLIAKPPVHYASIGVSAALDAPKGEAPSYTLSQDIGYLRYEAEKEEMKVISLRQRHMDTYQTLKDLTHDVEVQGSRLRQSENVRSELEGMKIQLAAAEADPSFLDAQSAHDRYISLLDLVKQQHSDIVSIRTEKQAMIMHLMEGCKHRAEVMYNHRKRIADRCQRKAADAAAGKGSHVPTLLSQQSDEHLSLLYTLNEENKKQRAASINVLLNIAKEKEASEQYIGVLSERSGNLMQLIRQNEAAKLSFMTV